MCVRLGRELFSACGYAVIKRTQNRGIINGRHIYMKRITSVLAILLVICPLCLAVFCGCPMLYTNDRSSVGLMAVEERDDGLYFAFDYDYRHGHLLKYDAAASALSLEEASVELALPEVVLDVETTAHGRKNAAEGYESLLEQVLALPIDGEDYPIHHALAYKSGRTVYGFCNIYSTAGWFTDGLDSRGIELAVTFEYDFVTEKLTIIEELEKCIIVAFDGTGVVWLQDGIFYGKAFGKEAVEICNDEAYDRGPTNYSYAQFYFGGGYCLLYFHNEQNYIENKDSEKNFDLYVLATTTGKKLAELKIPQSYE